ncbi:uncharacterized protein [Ambystoma mexicanum]|uniref:uncharacterized protein n=1 Tax=Ambystoma mexicanum TaxID=8296 RepID=UPI0037E8E5D8
MTARAEEANASLTLQIPRRNTRQTSKLMLGNSKKQDESHNSATEEEYNLSQVEILDCTPLKEKETIKGENNNTGSKNHEVVLPIKDKTVDTQKGEIMQQMCDQQSNKGINPQTTNAEEAINPQRQRGKEQVTKTDKKEIKEPATSIEQKLGAKSLKQESDTSKHEQPLVSQKEKAIKAKEQWKLYYQRASKSERFIKEIAPISQCRMERLSLDLTEIETLMELQQINRNNRKQANLAERTLETSNETNSWQNYTDLSYTTTNKIQRANKETNAKKTNYMPEESVGDCPPKPGNKQESVTTSMLDLQDMLVAVTTQTMIPYIKLQEASHETMKEHTTILNSISTKRKNLELLVYKLQERLSIEAENSYIWQQRLAEIARQDRTDKATLMEALISFTKTSITKNNMEGKNQKEKDQKLGAHKIGSAKIIGDSTQNRRENNYNDETENLNDMLLIDLTPEELKTKINKKPINRTAELITNTIYPQPETTQGYANYSIFEQQSMNNSNKTKRKWLKKQTKKQQRGSRAFLRNLAQSAKDNSKKPQLQKHKEMSIVDTVTKESAARTRGVEESTQTQEIISEGDNLQSVSVSSSEEGNIESLLNLSTYSTQEPEKVRNEDKSGEGQQEQQPNPASMLTIDCYEETITESYISIELSCEEISDEELYTGNSTLNTRGKERIDQEQQPEETNKNRDKRADRRMKQPRNEERSKIEQLQFVDPYYKESVMRLKLEGRSEKEANIVMNRTNLLRLFKAIPKLEKLKSKDLKQIEFRDEQRLDKIWIYCRSRELKSLISSCAEELEDRGFSRGFRVSNDDKTNNDMKETPSRTQQESNRTYWDISSDESNLYNENKGWSEIEEVRWYKDEKKRRNSIQYKDKTPNKWNFEKSPFWREISMEKSRNEETKKPRQ